MINKITKTIYLVKLFGKKLIPLFLLRGANEELR